MGKNTLLGVGFALVAVIGFTGLVVCTPAQKEVATAGIDLATAACTVAATQDEPGWVKLVCVAIEVGGSVAKTIIVKLPEKSEAARAMRAQMMLCPSAVPLKASPSVSGSASVKP